MSRRVYFLLAIAKGKGQQVINAVNNLEYVNEPGVIPKLVYTKNGNQLEIHLKKLVGNISLPAYPSTASDGKWSVFLLIPDDPYKHEPGTNAFKKLRRRIKSAGNTDVHGAHYLAGPYSLKALERASTALAEKWLNTKKPTAWDVDGNPTAWEPDKSKGLYCPCIIAGDDEHYSASIDYDPSDQDCIDDVEPNEGELFPGG